MTKAMWLFSIATLAPIPLIAGAALFGGTWAALALIYLTLLAACLDEAIALVAEAEDDDREFPVADALSATLAVAHFGLLALAVWALAGEWLSSLEKAALFFSAGWFFGQVSNSNAHELIHRGSRLLHRLGKWVYISLLFGHHTSAHPLVHHVHVATDKDPNSARRGQSYYRFLPRAWIGSFKAGFQAETARLNRASLPAYKHPYVTYVGGSAGWLVLAGLIGGPAGALWALMLAGFAQSQLMLSDYVQHYGLRRRIMENGKPEPVGPAHSWNTPHWFTSALMLNAPRHSDHHAHPARPYPALRLTDDMPTLPRSLPVMGALALAPRLWRRIMDPRVEAVMRQNAELTAS